MSNEGETPKAVNLSECQQDGSGKTSQHVWQWYKDPANPQEEFPRKQQCVRCGNQRIAEKKDTYAE